MRYTFRREVYCVLVRQDEVDVGEGTVAEVEAARAAWEESLGGAHVVAVDPRKGQAFATVVRNAGGELVLAESEGLPEWAALDAPTDATADAPPPAPPAG